MGKRSFLLSAVLALVAAGLVASAGGVSAAPVAGNDVTYTTDADFDQGTLVNVNHDAPANNQLQLNTTSGTFPFIWVALSVRCTIAKIDTVTGEILGEYRTISDSSVYGCNESSRTTVGIDGSVWVGHRGPGGVTHVGLAELNQCIDRDDSGTIETSTGYDDVLPWAGSTDDVTMAEDECILGHVDTNALGMNDSRHMSIDADGNLWVGDYSGGHKFVRIDSATATVETAVRSFGCGGYGGLIDGDGVIWSANGANTGMLRWDPEAPDSATNPMCVPVPVYGIAVDSGGSIWVTDLGSVVYKVSPDGTTIDGPFPHGAGNAQGLAIDENDDVWVSSSLFCGGGCTVGHLKNDGTFVGNVPNPTGAGSTGVSVDTDGNIWTANRNSNTATRIDPTAGPIGADGVTPVGAVDLTVDFLPGLRGSPFPYNYSDMTGAQLLSSTAPQGSWTVVQDSGTAGRTWGTIAWNDEPQGSQPAGTSIIVEGRAADTEAGLGGQTYEAVSDGVPFALVGRYIQVRVTLKPNSAGTSPVLSDIRIRAADEGRGCRGLTPTIRGTNASETINGTAAADVIIGLSGNDVINGMGGNDVICGSKGNDRINGDAGADRLYGDDGADVLMGNDGNDFMHGNGNNDMVHGNADDDSLWGDYGGDKLFCGSGVDTADGGPRTDSNDGLCETAVHFP